MALENYDGLGKETLATRSKLMIEMDKMPFEERARRTQEFYSRINQAVYHPAQPPTPILKRLMDYAPRAVEPFVNYFRRG